MSCIIRRLVPFQGVRGQVPWLSVRLDHAGHVACSIGIISSLHTRCCICGVVQKFCQDLPYYLATENGRGVATQLGGFDRPRFEILAGLLWCRIHHPTLGLSELGCIFCRRNGSSNRKTVAASVTQSRSHVEPHVWAIAPSLILQVSNDKLNPEILDKVLLVTRYGSSITT